MSLDSSSDVQNLDENPTEERLQQAAWCQNCPKALLFQVKENQVERVCEIQEKDTSD